jgi:hypothetical protein
MVFFTEKGLFRGNTALFAGKRCPFSSHQAGLTGGTEAALGGL